LASGRGHQSSGRPPGRVDQDLAEVIKGPDFPTGAIIYGAKASRSATRRARPDRDSARRATVEEREVTGKQQIVVTEFPYRSLRRVIEQIRDLVVGRTWRGQRSPERIRQGGIRVVIELKRDASRWWC